MLFNPLYMSDYASSPFRVCGYNYLLRASSKIENWARGVCACTLSGDQQKFSYISWLIDFAHSTRVRGMVDEIPCTHKNCILHASEHFRIVRREMDI